MPGETIELRNGRVYIDNHLLEETYHPYLGMRSHPATQIPLDQYFLLGDNRDHSGDSRIWGSARKELIIGRVWVSLWPPERWDWYGWPWSSSEAQASP
jgi:signal peptidase I